MSDRAASRLVEYLINAAGEYLRGVVHYTEDDYRVLYLREDLESVYSEDDLTETFDYWRRRRDDQRGPPFSLGNLHCTAQFFDDALLFHFTQGSDVGTVVTLDPAAGRDVTAFIGECLTVLHTDSPQEIQNAPTWIRS